MRISDWSSDVCSSDLITVVFSSSAYLDVSVQQVCLLPVNRENTWSSTRWVAPFGYPRINSYVPIPAAFRSLSRPSSPLRAKASTLRPSLLSWSPEAPKDGSPGPCLLAFAQGGTASLCASEIGRAHV